MNDWIPVTKLEEIPRLGARTLQAGELDIALFRTGSDEVFALRDRCPHRGGPLSQGIVHGEAVTCPLHNWKIDLQSGEVQGPDQGCVHSFAVRIEEGVVYLDVASLESAA
ncbi:MAG: nitrite reductase small subunit NirD [Candidatus Thiodiazotropha taylori]|nr:nitrite reductase small subunit NirD [Candidatus Thiodiazotropha taylori]MCG8108295.1 nitrite reductase small subunit NirD [Candidatus Thiodiazotropha taylori]MCG8109427.1 nitrite reductase small subunit NirD [Candidatus Thiodiazotropha taylori]MCW4280634.1 nitrite reductase small subunit NirD [Candidatus Thiodiazotropha taylori]MCW4281766.1 nitrite reductase small subunit NirD [Candidatus Thiodiazotropha taylori]